MKLTRRKHAYLDNIPGVVCAEPKHPVSLGVEMKVCTQKCLHLENAFIKMPFSTAVLMRDPGDVSYLYDTPLHAEVYTLWHTTSARGASWLILKAVSA